MPRIYDSTSDPMDFCKRCFPTKTIALTKYGNIGEGPDDRGNCFAYNADHPPYDEDVDYPYHCHNCGNPLTGRDE